MSETPISPLRRRMIEDMNVCHRGPVGSTQAPSRRIRETVTS